MGKHTGDTALVPSWLLVQPFHSVCGCAGRLYNQRYVLGHPSPGTYLVVWACDTKHAKRRHLHDLRASVTPIVLSFKGAICTVIASGEVGLVYTRPSTLPYAAPHRCIFALVPNVLFNFVVHLALWGGMAMSSAVCCLRHPQQYLLQRNQAPHLSKQ